MTIGEVPNPTPLTPLLDPGIEYAVRCLRAHGVETFESCDGSEGHSYPEPTVRFHGNKGAGWHALSVCEDFDLPWTSLAMVWTQEGSGPAGPFWELRFRRMA